MDRLFPVLGLPLHIAIAGSLALLILGAWEGVDEALCVTALTAGVVFAGYTLLALTTGQTHDLEPGPPDQRDQDVRTS